MKKYLVTALSLFAAFNLSAQITLEKSYPVTSPGERDLQVIHLELSGYKYALRDEAANQVRLYNLDHSIWKTIPVSVPSGYTNWNHGYISERLFNLDASVELMVEFNPTMSGGSKTIVLTESGTTLMTIDTTDFDLDVPMVFNTGNGYKLIMSVGGNRKNVYSLPGSIPCDKCGNGLGIGKVVLPGSGGSLGEPIPNPSNGNVEIKYELPVGVSEGQIDVYNTNGQLVKSFHVDGTFNSIRLDNSGFSSGVYYYSLKSNGQISQAKRMIVVP